MTKWYEEIPLEKGSNFISSRVRLARNWEDYAFPGKLNMAQAAELVGRLQYGLDDLDSVTGETFSMTTLDKMKETERYAFRERRIMNAAVASKKTPVGFMVSAKEDVSIILNGDDHIRMQFLAPGLDLGRLWDRADRVDDFINSRFRFAFDEKYGYLTSFPTNVGTGMRANLVLHLPTLSKNSQSRALIDGLTRFGVSIRGVYGQGRENYGSLYDISNAKTLGMNENEIIDLVQRIGKQLNSNENEAHQVELSKRGLELRDEAYRAYGILKYARKMPLKSALQYLSQLMTGVKDGFLTLDRSEQLYGFMLQIQPSNLMCGADHPLGQEELDELRATFLRQQLPEMKEA